MATPHRLVIDALHHDLCEEAQWKLSALLPAAWHERFQMLVVVGKAAEEIVGVAQEMKANRRWRSSSTEVKLAGIRIRLTRILNQISTVPCLSEAFTSPPQMTNQADFVTV